MSKKSAELREVLRNFINATVGVSVLQGEVKSIDESKWTCDVELPNTLLLYDVQLKCLKETEKGCVLVPKVGSWVQIMNVGEPDWLVIAIEQLDKVIVLADTEVQVDVAGSTVVMKKDSISVNSNGSSVLMNKDGITLNDGKKGGLINIAQLVERVNKLEDDNNALKDVFVNWSVLAQDGGAALKSAATGTAAPATPAVPGTWAANKIVKTKRSDIEDTKVKH
jgi:hypothetical protein